ncbi:MAG: hypothetical protein ABI430_01020 [Candidatus Taylorbacteria bacterium]
MTCSSKKEKGFIALISVILISLIMTTIVFTLNLGGFSARFNVLDSEFKEMSSSFAKSCRDIALLKLSTNSAYSPSSGGDEISLSETETEHKCTIFSIMPQGVDLLIRTRSRFQNTYSNVETLAKETGGIWSIVSSNEIAQF